VKMEQQHCQINLTAGRTVKKGVVGVNQNELWERPTIYTVPLVRYMGKPQNVCCSSPVTEDVPPRRDRSIHGVPPSVSGLVHSRSVPLHPTSVTGLVHSRSIHTKC
jgi:hypothetical protein